jgi:hypothetical protein
MAPSIFDKYRIVLHASKGLSMGQIAQSNGYSKKYRVILDDCGFFS